MLLAPSRRPAGSFGRWPYSPLDSVGNLKSRGPLLKSLWNLQLEHSLCFYSCVSIAFCRFNSLFRGDSLESFVLLPIGLAWWVAPDNVAVPNAPCGEPWLQFESRNAWTFNFWTPLRFFLFIESPVHFSFTAVTLTSSYGNKELLQGHVILRKRTCIIAFQIITASYSFLWWHIEMVNTVTNLF